MTFFGIFTTKSTGWYGQSGPALIYSLDFTEGRNSQYLHLVMV